MRLTTNRLPILLAHGLHEAEAKTYLALLDHPSLTAATLSKLAEVPRSHLYKVLQGLQSKGLVEILLQGDARSYRARPLRGFLEHRASELRARIADLEDEMDALASAFEPPPMEDGRGEDAGDVRVVMGRRAVARQIDEMIAAARARVGFAASDQGFERSIRHVLPRLQHGAPRAARLQVDLFLPATAVGHPMARQVAAHPGVSVRWLRVPRGMMSILQDDAAILFVNPMPDTHDMRAGRDFAIFSGDRTFVENHRRLLVAASTEEPPSSSSSLREPS